MPNMRAAVFLGKGQIKVREVPRPVPKPGEALVKITLTTLHAPRMRYDAVWRPSFFSRVSCTSISVMMPKPSLWSAIVMAPGPHQGCRSGVTG